MSLRSFCGFRFLQLQIHQILIHISFPWRMENCWSKKSTAIWCCSLPIKRAYRIVFTIYCCNITERSLYRLRFMAYCNIHWCWNQIITILMKNSFFSPPLSLTRHSAQCSSSFSIKCCVAKNYQYKIEHLVISMCSQ